MLNKALIFLIIFIFISINSFAAAAPPDKKEELTAYIKNLVSIITEADFIIRDVEFNNLPLKEGAKRLKGAIEKIKPLKYPVSLGTLHKKVLLSFKKIRKGFLLFTPERREEPIKLVKGGVALLKSAASEIKYIIEKEGLKKKPGDVKGPSKPQITVPVTALITEPADVPDSGNIIGEVLATGFSEGKNWIDIKDPSFKQAVKITLDPEKTLAVKESKKIESKGINKGDTVSIAYSKEDGRLTAHFISVITGKDLLAIQETLPQE